MKKTVWILRLAALCCALALAVVCAAAADAVPASFQNAKGAVLMEAATGRVLAQKDADERLLNASTTKIMTAILVLEQPNLDESFVADPDAILVEGSSMGLQQGDVVTLRTLAWGMLLASGNDAANAAAVRIDGSIDAFCARMNRKAAALGMKNTLFASPSGLETGEHYTTAYDLALLTRYALQNDDFCEMARAKSAKLYYGNPPYHRWLTNHNRLLWQCEDCIGVKTGFTKAAGRCLVSAAQRDGLTLIAVTLGCPDDFRTHHGLYDESFAALQYVEFGELVGALSVPVTGAEQPRVPVQALYPPGAYLTAAERERIGLSLLVEPFLYAPVQQGQVVGEATLRLGETALCTVPLIAGQEVPARFPEYRSIIQRVKDFFAYPENHRFPLSGGQRNNEENRIENPQGIIR